MHRVSEGESYKINFCTKFNTFSKKTSFLPITFRFSLKFSISNGSINKSSIDSELDPSWPNGMALVSGSIFVVTKMPLFFDINGSTDRRRDGAT